MGEDEDARARARAVWAGGDYTRVSELVRPAADELIRAAVVKAGDRVLDVAAGDGNATVAAAAAGAHVTASDVAPAMIELGRARTRDLGIEWVEADAQALPFEDAAFDVTLSVFGAMFAPDPHRTAAELVRVTRSGGLVGMTTWIPEGAQAAVNTLIATRLPGVRSPLAEHWGVPDKVQAFFGDAVELTTHRRALRWPFRDAEAWWEYLQAGPPPVVAARAALGEELWALVSEEALMLAREMCETPAGGFVFETPYLVVLARVR